MDFYREDPLIVEWRKMSSYILYSFLFLAFPGIRACFGYLFDARGRHGRNGHRHHAGYRYHYRFAFYPGQPHKLALLSLERSVGNPYPLPFSPFLRFRLHIHQVFGIGLDQTDEIVHLPVRNNQGFLLLSIVFPYDILEVGGFRFNLLEPLPRGTHKDKIVYGRHEPFLLPPRPHGIAVAHRHKTLYAIAFQQLLRFHLPTVSSTHGEPHFLLSVHGSSFFRAACARPQTVPGILARHL